MEEETKMVNVSIRMPDWVQQKIENPKPKNRSELYVELLLKGYSVKQMEKHKKNPSNLKLHQAPIPYSKFDPIQKFHNSLKSQKGLFSPS